MKKESIDIVFSFDTTGSMYPCLGAVRRSISNTVQRLFKDIADLRIAIIAHGDYCDAKTTYVIKTFDFSRNVTDICNFINNVGPTFGGDSPECYELVLNKARSLSWGSGRNKVLTMIGDDIPHSANYPGNVDNIDWRNELGLLIESGIQVYGCHAMPGTRGHSKPFYQEIAKTTGGFYLTLDQFSTITDLILAICYHQNGDAALASFEKEAASLGRMSRDLKNSIRTMRGLEPEVIKVSKEGLRPIPAGRFQIFDVHEDADIMGFVTGVGAGFNKGRGFYELTKSVKVQQYKEIILQDKCTGDIFNGSQVRENLGLYPQIAAGGITERLNKSHLMDKYTVFIQSTSYNRKLLSGTKFLYEVSDWDMVPDVIASESDVVKSVKKLAKKLATKMVASKKVTKKKVTKKKVTKKKVKTAAKRATDITIPPRLENAFKAYVIRKSNPDMSWEEVAERTPYNSGSSARRGANKIAKLYAAA